MYKSKRYENELQNRKDQKPHLPNFCFLLGK